MKRKNICILFITIVASVDAWTENVYIGSRYSYFCPQYDANNYNVDTYRALLVTEDNLEIAELTSTDYGYIRLHLTFNQFDNELILKCIPMITNPPDTYRINFSLRNTTRTTNLPVAAPVKSEVHYYRDDETYYFDYEHSAVEDLSWIKVNDDKIQTGSHTKTARLIVPLHLTSADNGTKLYCFHFRCVPVYYYTSNDKDCSRVILKSITLQLIKNDAAVKDSSPIVPVNSGVVTSVLIALMVSLVTIFILLLIIWNLLRRLARHSSNRSPQPAAASHDEPLYNNLDFGKLNIPIEYASLSLAPTSGRVPRGDHVEYTAVAAGGGAPGRGTTRGFSAFNNSQKLLHSLGVPDEFL